MNRDRDSLGRALASFLVGGALGITLETGAALMLYSGLGVLSAAGFITAVALAALAAGVWVGAPEHHAEQPEHHAERPGHGAEQPGHPAEQPAHDHEQVGADPPEHHAAGDAVPSSIGRWFSAILALMFAAIYAGGWERVAQLRVLPLGRAVAVLLMIAWPAYALGALLGTLDARVRRIAAEPAFARHAGRERTGTAVLALAGAAIGVAWGGLILIPRLPASYVLGACAAVLAFAAGWETRRHPGHF